MAGNFGDMINEPLYRAMTGKRNPPKDVLAIGTVMRSLDGHTVWGSGYGPGKPLRDRHPKKSTFRAVRGPLTREAMIDFGYDVPEVYGDPGLLIRRYLKPTTKKGGKGVVFFRHKSDEREFPGMDLMPAKRCEDPMDYINQLNEYDVIVSSSLHGLIAADALGIPSHWCSFTYTRTPDGQFKFLDYFASLGVTPICRREPEPEIAAVRHVPEEMLDTLEAVCPWMS